MQLRKSKGRMFKSVDWTATYYQGCDHGCKFCWTLFMPVPISHVPCLKQTNEFQVIRRRKKEGVVFLNSAHDSYSSCIPDEWINSMHRWIGRQHEGLVFYLLSQNIQRALTFLPQLEKIKEKVIMGTTLQTDIEKIISKFSDAPSIQDKYQGIRRFGDEGFRIRLSLEPLFSFNYRPLRNMVFDINPELTETGLDNYAHRHKLEIPQPDRCDYKKLYKDMTEYGIPVVEKASIEKWRRTGKR